MTEATRKAFLKQLGNRPEDHCALALGTGPEMSPEVRNFFAHATGNLFPGPAAQKSLDAKYKYMSVAHGHPAAKGSPFSPAVGEFFCNLFRKVHELSGHQLDKTDLWHGHLIELDDHTLWVVFHAKEYPRDIPGESAGSPVGDFSSESDAFRWRNVLWSHARNQIYKVDAGVFSLAQGKLKGANAFYMNVIEDFAKEIDALDKAAGNKVRASRTLPQEEMGRQLYDLYYLVDEAFYTAKSDHVVIDHRSA